MKVILLESVPKVGSVNEIVEVSNGFAMNSLIPKGLARVASEKNVAQIEKQIKENKAKDDARKKELATTIRALNGETITMHVSANEKGTLFSALSASDVSDRIKEEKNLEIEPAYIELDQAIKETGTHKITLRVEDVTCTLNLEITPEN
ncbi:MAG: 50S ribosomal protein L9 [Candidatus Paceibacterota bacterium]